MNINNFNIENLQILLMYKKAMENFVASTNKIARYSAIILHSMAYIYLKLLQKHYWDNKWEMRQRNEHKTFFVVSKRSWSENGLAECTHHHKWSNDTANNPSIKKSVFKTKFSLNFDLLNESNDMTIN